MAFSIRPASAVISAKPKTHRVFSAIGIALILVLTGVPSQLRAQPSDIQALLAQVNDARNAVANAKDALNRAVSARRTAVSTLSAAEAEAFTAELDYDSALRRSATSQSASSYLSGAQSTVQALRSELAGIPDTPANQARRDSLSRQIRAATQHLSDQAERYGRRTNQALSEIDQARQRHENARKAVSEARQKLAQAEQVEEAARQNLNRAEAHLGEMLEKMAARADELAPAFLSSVRIAQDGKDIYQAEWREDESEHRRVKELIAELEREITELERIRALIVADIARYKREADTAQALLGPLEEQRGWNNNVILWSNRLQYFGEALLLAASGASIIQGVSTAVSGAMAAGEQVTARLVARETARYTALELGIGGAPNALRWKEYAMRTRRLFRARAAVQTGEALLASAPAWVEPAAAITSAIQYGSTAYGMTNLPSERYTGPDVARFRARVNAAINKVKNFKNTRQGFLARHEARHSFVRQSDQFMRQALREQEKKIREKDESFWRSGYALYVGKIFTSDAEIAVAEATTQIMYWSAVEKAYRAHRRIALKERDDIDEAISEHRERLQELREELPGAPVRKLSVTTNEKLGVEEGKRATITLAFSQALKEAPLVKIGTGTIARPPDDEAGEGLPLPGPDEGAVLVSMTGGDTNWSGDFATSPLNAFVESDDAIQIEVNGTDYADRALDADPRTAARPAGGGWTYHESVSGGSPRGGGGPDMWHALNAIYGDGTSYVFVVDASGSMDENNRMNRVKSSARTFVANMERADEVALWAFFGCGNIQLLQSFTRDKEQFLSVLDWVYPNSDTALAAGISRGGDYLLAQSTYGERALVILTDGEETCGGDPAAAAALFRRQVAVLGDLGESRPWSDEEPPQEEPVAGDEEEEDEEKVVEVQPADREAWTIEQSGAASQPTLSLIRTHFREWGEDGACAAQVTRAVYYAYYGSVQDPSGNTRIRWGVNPSPSSRETLDFAICTNGQAGMDEIRSRWRRLEGDTQADARAELGRKVESLLR